MAGVASRILSISRGYPRYDFWMTVTSYLHLDYDWEPGTARCWVEGQGVRAVFTNCYFRCTNCDEIKPAAEVQLRRMSSGEIRNQAQCSACRKKGKAPPA